MTLAMKTRRTFAPWKKRRLVFLTFGLFLFWLVFVAGTLWSLEWALGPYDSLSGL